MSRQVLLGGVIGFLITVVVMAVCQKSEPMPAPPPAGGPIQVKNLEPMQLDAPKKQLPVALPARPPIGSLPSVARPLHLEGFDAGHR